MAGRQATAARRWFQFSLTSLFLLTTVVAAWLAWELAFIRGRQAWLRENAAIADPEAGSFLTAVALPPATPSIPWWRRILGDGAVTTIIEPDEWTDDDRAIVARLFPEATVAKSLDLSIFKMPGDFETVSELQSGQLTAESVQGGQP